MHLETYPVVSDPQRRAYEFISEGPRGRIKKVVQYEHLGFNAFNLSLGDWDEGLQDILHDNRSNNSDRDKVLATVASTVSDFMKHYPDAIIHAKGNTPAKTRLYQIGISLNWHAISQMFEVKGYADDTWQPFTRQKNYEAFYLRKKM